MLGGGFRYRPVFSAHAEVVPCEHKALNHFEGILRARGGSSTTSDNLATTTLYSPRTRR